MKKYLIGSAIVLSLAFSVSANSVKALTSSEAEAIIAALSLDSGKAAAIRALVSAPAMMSSSASASFPRSLSVGSTGSDVTALQTWLASKGFLSASATGYFGSMTKAGVAKYQASVGLPSTGFFGPRTIASIGGSSTVSTPGYTVTTSPVTSVAPVAADGTDGSITASQSSYVSSGQTVKKGETKDLIAIQLQATSGAVTVNRFDVHFNLRPWLYFGKLTLKDSTGAIIATKMITGQSDATEVTVGSDYLVRFDSVNYVVKPGPNQILVVSGTVLNATDKVLTTQAVSISIPTGALRTINGKGYTDSVGNIPSTSITITATGSTGDVLARISPSTPSQRIVTTSVSQTTSNVTLGVFSLKSQNNSSTINSLNFVIPNSTGAATTSIFSNVRLVDGSTVYGANSVAAGATTFTNLSISLPQDTWKDFTLMADVASNISSVSASSTLIANATNIVGVDSNFNVVTASGGNTVTSNDTTLLLAGVSVSNTSATIGTTVTGAQGGVSVTTAYNVNYTFTLTNTSNSDVFISKNPAVALGTSTNYSGTTDGLTAANASSSLTYVTPNASTYAGDTTASYIIPAGSSRVFAYTGQVKKNGNTSGTRVLKITAIYFGTVGTTDGPQAAASSNATNSVNFGLENLVLSNIGF